MMFFGFNILIFLTMISLVESFQYLQLFQTVTSVNKFIYFTAILCFVQLFASFMMVLCYAYYEVKVLNKFLVSTVEGSNKIRTPNIFRKVSIIYDKLCDLHDVISSFYLFSNLIFLMGLFYFNVFLFYSLYIYLRNPTVDLGYYFLTLLAWYFFYFPCVICIAVSSLIEFEGCKTYHLIQILARTRGSKKSLRSCSIFELQTKHRTPKITCGLFHINWKMFFTLIVGVFSSFIITVQFYDVSNS